MCSLLAFFPGKRRLTNGMLSDLRAAGVYAGKGKALGWRLKPGYDAFAVETAAIRRMVALRFARVADDVRCWEGRVQVLVWVVGHHKSDSDAWLLLGKAAVDGLVDAKALRRDRSGVDLGGKVSHRRASEDTVWQGVCGRGVPLDRGEVGFWLRVGSGCGCAAAPKVLP